MDSVIFSQNVTTLLNEYINLHEKHLSRLAELTNSPHSVLLSTATTFYNNWQSLNKNLLVRDIESGITSINPPTLGKFPTYLEVIKEQRGCIEKCFSEILPKKNKPSYSFSFFSSSQEPTFQLDESTVTTLKSERNKMEQNLRYLRNTPVESTTIDFTKSVVPGA